MDGKRSGSHDPGRREGLPLQGVQPHQLRAAREPGTPIRTLAASGTSNSESNKGAAPALKPADADAGPANDGNFQDLQALLDQLGAPPVFELGNPLPQPKHLPGSRAGTCPAAHNEGLFRLASKRTRAR